MSTRNIGFYEDLTKNSLNYHQISSNMHLISSAEVCHTTSRPAVSCSNHMPTTYPNTRIVLLTKCEKILTFFQQNNICVFVIFTVKILTNCSLKMLFEPRCEKTGLRGFRPGPT